MERRGTWVLALRSILVAHPERGRNRGRVRDDAIERYAGGEHDEPPRLVADGKLDGLVKISGNTEVNLMVTDIIMKKIKELEDSIELNKKIAVQNALNEAIQNCATTI